MLGQETQELVGVAGSKLFRQAQKNVTRHFVGTKDGEVCILLVLLLGECRAGPRFMHDAAAGDPTEWTLATPFSKEPEALAG